MGGRQALVAYGLFRVAESRRLEERIGGLAAVSRACRRLGDLAEERVPRRIGWFEERDALLEERRRALEGERGEGAFGRRAAVQEDALPVAGACRERVEP